MRAARRTAWALLAVSIMPASRSRASWPASDLRIGRVPQTKPTTDRCRPACAALGDRLPHHRRDLGCRIGVRAVAEHDVEQNDRGLRDRAPR